MPESTSGEPTTARPATLTWAVVLLVGFNLASWGLVLLLGRDTVAGGAMVLGLTTSAQVILLSWGLWERQRWAALVVSVVTVPNFVALAAGVLGEPEAWSIALVAVGIPMTLLPVLLIWHPASRRAYR